MRNVSYAMVRPVGLGLSQEEIEAAAAGALAASDAGLREWDSKFTNPRDGDVGTRVRAMALGWDQGAAVMRGPWEDDRSFFNAFHDGGWRTWTGSSFDAPHEDLRRIAMGIGLRTMHWPALQAAHPGCWVFAMNHVDQEPEVRLAIVESMRFADAFVAPDHLLREALRRYGHDVGYVTTRLQAPRTSVENRMRRLGIPIEWRPRGTPAPANDARATA